MSSSAINRDSVWVCRMAVEGYDAQRGERRDIGSAVERHVHKTVGVLVRGAVAYSSRSSLLLMRASITAARYVDNVLKPLHIACGTGLSPRSMRECFAVATWFPGFKPHRTCM